MARNSFIDGELRCHAHRLMSHPPRPFMAQAAQFCSRAQKSYTVSQNPNVNLPCVTLYLFLCVTIYIFYCILLHFEQTICYVLAI